MTTKLNFAVKEELSKVDFMAKNISSDSLDEFLMSASEVEVFARDMGDDISSQITTLKNSAYRSLMQESYSKASTAAYKGNLSEMEFALQDLKDYILQLPSDKQEPYLEGARLIWSKGLDMVDENTLNVFAKEMVKLQKVGYSLGINKVYEKGLEAGAAGNTLAVVNSIYRLQDISSRINVDSSSRIKTLECALKAWE